MDYKIVKATDISWSSLKNRLELEVNLLMSEGYKPQGGVSIAIEEWNNTRFYTVCQAMIKVQKVLREEL